MIHAAYALPDDEPSSAGGSASAVPPLDGPDIASTLGWSHFSEFCMARSEQYPECAHLGCFGWSDQPDDLAHELEQVQHDAGADVAAVAGQVLAALRQMPDGATFYVTDGEAAGDEGDDDD